MAFSSRQITLAAATATPLLVKGSGSGTTFKNIVGTVTDPVPVMFMITTGTVYWGGTDVTNSNGMLMTANVPVVMNLYGEGEIPYCYQAAGGAVVSVVLGRQ
jgi:hypothetical protein